MTTDPIAAARALIAANSLPAGNVGHGHVFPRPDGVRARCGGPKMCKECAADLARKLDPWSALATLADVVEAERDALVAAAYEAAAELVVLDHVCDSIRALAPSDAQAALDKLLEEARLEGWRAGRDAAAESAHKYAAKCSEQSEDSRYNERFETASYFEIGADAVEYIARTIRMMPEPQEASPAGRSEADARRRYAVQLLHQAVDLAMSQAEGRA